jgi:hypothetical protein
MNRSRRWAAVVALTLLLTGVSGAIKSGNSWYRAHDGGATTAGNSWYHAHYGAGTTS